LVRDRVTVLVAAGGIASAVAAKAATREIPIVFATGADPPSLRGGWLLMVSAEMMVRSGFLPMFSSKKLRTENAL
jgi:hypothetical protein